MSEKRNGLGRHGPELSPGLDSATLADPFARSRLIQIPALLTAASAGRLHHALAHETPWTLSHNIDGNCNHVPDLSPGDRMTLALAARQRARNTFAFFHDSHALSHDGEPYARPNHTFAGLVAFLNSPDFLGFVGRVTGMDEIRLADGEATLYRPGDYRTRQDGAAAGKNRLAGYELSITPAWRFDWGGVLQFIGTSGNVARGYVPTFNTLTVFAVPRTHFVSQVALHGGLRYAVSGWLRSGGR